MRDWVGQPWAETVTVESRPKVEALLRDAAAKAAPRWRQVNHPSARRRGCPGALLRHAESVRVTAWWRSAATCAPISALQQRLVDAQQSMERDYWRLRQRGDALSAAVPDGLRGRADRRRVHPESRGSQSGGRPVLGETAKRLVGRPFPEGFDAAGTQAVQTLLAGVRAAGRADDVRVRSADGQR